MCVTPFERRLLLVAHPRQRLLAGFRFCVIGRRGSGIARTRALLCFRCHGDSNGAKYSEARAGNRDFDFVFLSLEPVTRLKS
jgi:hypothetical protein